MADKPSKALVFYGEGLASFVTPSHSHLHTVASRGCCGFLALDDSANSETEDERLVRELALLLDAQEADCSVQADDADLLCQKFMGMRAALMTDSSAAKSFGKKLGLTLLDFDKVKNDITIEASELLKLLGFEDGKLSDTCQFDLVLVHVGFNLKTDEQSNYVDCANKLVGQILEIAQPGSEVRSRLYLSVIMSYGKASEGDLKQLVPSVHDQKNSNLMVLIPRQSYALKGVNPRNGIRHQGPMLIAQWQEAVTRKDKAEKFSFDEFRKHCGNLAIPADRFLHEIAFKLWKAPKYGA
ncbi:hypothetical protein V2J09_022932 [Rumex salicifolius]